MASLAHPSLVLAATVAALAASVYLHVGRRFLHRAVPAPSRLPLRMFALWWLATGVNIALASGFILAAAFGHSSLWLQTTYGVLQRLLLGAALLGLVYYLLVMVRGRAPLLPLLLSYAAFAQLLIGAQYANEPTGVYVGDWRTDLDYARESPAWFALLSGAWLILPPVVLAMAALLVARRLDPSQRPQRNRITLVGLAIIVWWVVAAVAGQREAFGSESFQVFNRFLGLSMALVVLAAYEAPAWLRRRLPLPDDGRP